MIAAGRGSSVGAGRLWRFGRGRRWRSRKACVVSFLAAMSRQERGPPVDLTRLLRTTGGDLQVELELLRIFVEQTEEKLSSVGAALAANDFAQIREDAHSIKGASANVGADRLRELAASLEGRMKNGEHARAEALVAEVAEEFAAVREYLDDHRRRMTENEAGT
jgi:HPt (histidine-containing phosphotransfer) domain-containing protein